MSRNTASTLSALFLVVVIVGVDILLFRHHFWARLAANVGIILLFAACYLRFRSSFGR